MLAGTALNRRGFTVPPGIAALVAARSCALHRCNKGVEMDTGVGERLAGWVEDDGH